MRIIWDADPYATFSDQCLVFPASRADDRKCGEVIDTPVDAGRGGSLRKKALKAVSGLPGP